MTCKTNTQEGAMKFTFEMIWDMFWLGVLFGLLAFIICEEAAKFILSFGRPKSSDDALKNVILLEWIMFMLSFSLNMWLCLPPLGFSIWKVAVVNLVVLCAFKRWNSHHFSVWKVGFKFSELLKRWSSHRNRK